MTCISTRNRLIRKFETSYKGGTMTGRTLRRSVATLATVGAAALALAATGQADPNGRRLSTLEPIAPASARWCS